MQGYACPVYCNWLKLGRLERWFSLSGIFFFFFLCVNVERGKVPLFLWWSTLPSSFLPSDSLSYHSCAPDTHVSNLSVWTRLLWRAPMHSGSFFNFFFYYFFHSESFIHKNLSEVFQYFFIFYFNQYVPKYVLECLLLLVS